MKEYDCICVTLSTSTFSYNLSFKQILSYSLSQNKSLYCNFKIGTMQLTFQNTNVSAKFSSALVASGIFLSSWEYQNCYFSPSKCIRRPSGVHWYGAPRMSLFIMGDMACTILVPGSCAQGRTECFVPSEFLRWPLQCKLHCPRGIL